MLLTGTRAPDCTRKKLQTTPGGGLCLGGGPARQEQLCAPRNTGDLACLGGPGSRGAFGHGQHLSLSTAGPVPQQQLYLPSTRPTPQVLGTQCAHGSRMIDAWSIPVELWAPTRPALCCRRTAWHPGAPHRTAAHPAPLAAGHLLQTHVLLLSTGATMHLLPKRLRYELSLSRCDPTPVASTGVPSASSADRTS